MFGLMLRTTRDGSFQQTDSCTELLWFDASDASDRSCASVRMCDVRRSNHDALTQSTRADKVHPTRITPSLDTAPNTNSVHAHAQSAAIGHGEQISVHTRAQHTKPDVDRVHNLTGAALPPNLHRVLDMGPKFALSWTINSRIMEDAEIGFERGAFALRWRHFIESQQTGTKNVTPQNTGDTQQPSQTEPPAPTRAILPRFSDTDAKMAPTAPHPVEHEIRQLKHKVMTAYKTHKTKTSNHVREEKTGPRNR